VPRPFGEAAQLATTLGIGTHDVATHLLLDAPDPRWVAAVGSQPADTLLWPVTEGRLWRGYGRVRRRRARRHVHEGMDIGAREGALIRAVNDGLVLYANNELHGYGNIIMIVHADSSVTFYAHCHASYVFAGQRVRRGQTIGQVGHTGLAHGDHLHFEWRVNGRPRNPAQRFTEVPEDSRGLLSEAFRSFTSFTHRA